MALALAVDNTRGYVADLDTVRGPTHEPMAGPDWDGTTHADIVQKFESSEEASRDSREKAERDIDYFDNKQLTEQEVRELKKRGQPPIVKNRIRRKIRYLMGLEKSARTDPKAVPRTPQREQDAFAATAALRFVADQNRYDQTRSKTFKDVMSAGWGGYEITVKQQPGETNPRIVIQRAQWDRMFWDPYCGEDDFSDANFLGLVIWMDREEAIRSYGMEAAKVFDETTSGFVGGTFDDKPKAFTWVSYDKKRVRIRVVQMYFRHPDTGQWCYAEFTKGGYLKADVSPWLDENGEPEHPYEWASANVDRDNNRYGEIREMIDVQDAINKRESKLLHLVNVRQTFGRVDAIVSPMTAAGKATPPRRYMQEQLARPDGHVELQAGMEWGKDAGIIPTGDMATAQFELLQASNAEMDLMGPNAAMQGKSNKDASGRAILASQQGGAIEMGSLTDTLRDLDVRTYRKVWRRIRQFWTGQQWVSVTDDLKNLKWVGLNEPQMVPGPPDPMTGQPSQQPMMDPATGQPILRNAVSELDVNITFEDAPQVGTMLDEQFQSLVQLKGMDQNGEIPFKAIIMAAPNLAAKGEILEAIEQREQQAAQPNPMALAGAKAELDDKQATTEGKRANSILTVAKAKHEDVLASREAVGTHLDLAQIIMDAMQPQQAPQPAAAPA